MRLRSSERPARSRSQGGRTAPAAAGEEEEVVVVGVEEEDWDWGEELEGEEEVLGAPVVAEEEEE